MTPVIHPSSGTGSLCFMIVEHVKDDVVDVPVQVCASTFDWTNRDLDERHRCVCVCVGVCLCVLLCGLWGRGLSEGSPKGFRRVLSGGLGYSKCM